MEKIGKETITAFLTIHKALYQGASISEWLCCDSSDFIPSKREKKGGRFFSSSYSHLRVISQPCPAQEKIHVSWQAPHLTSSLPLIMNPREMLSHPGEKNRPQSGTENGARSFCVRKMRPEAESYLPTLAREKNMERLQCKRDDWAV